MVNRIIISLVFFLSATLHLSAQRQPFGHLTIFSEDGDKFTLILNGEKINDTPQSNLRVEELTQPYYSAKVIFEDKTKADISKSSLEIADMDNIFMDVTYKIKRDKNNASKMKLNFFSMTPVVQGYIPPANVYVQKYGSPAPAVAVIQGSVGSTTQSTTTTTTIGTGVSAGVNINGVGVNVSVMAPTGGTTITETTTVSSSVGSAPVEVYDGCANGRAMSPSNFNAALQTVKNQSFDDTRLKTAKQIASANCMTATQISDICKIFGFEDSRLDFAKFAYDACTEPNNYFKVNDVFTFSTSVDSLTEYIQSR